MLVENDGEIHFTTVTLEKEAKRFNLPVSAFRLYTYGNAKKADGRLSASGIADHPGDVLVQLGIRQHKSNILECLAFMQCPVLEAKADLRGDTYKHIIGDVGIFAVQDCGDGGGTHTIQAFRCTIA